MPKTNESNEATTITRETPFERAHRRLQEGAHIIRIYTETQLLLEGLQKAEGADPAMQPILDRLADEAIVALATELEEHHGVSA